MMGRLFFSVLPLVLFAQTPVIVESFSDAAFPPPGWDTTRSDTAMNYWIRYATSGANPDSHHARVQTHKTTDTLRQGFSELESSEFDLFSAVGSESLLFWFRFSANSQNLGPEDTVSLSIRGDSAAWCPLWKLGSDGQSNAWSVIRLSLAPYDGYRSARLRFRFDDRPNGGLSSANRYFWLDSVKVVSYPFGIADRSLAFLDCDDGAHVGIYPNPARNRIEFKLNPGRGHWAKSIVNVKGQRVPLGGSGASSSDFQTKGTELRIYDRTGRLIRFFTPCTVPYALCWDCTDQSGRVVPAGIYFCEALINGMKERHALVLIR